MLRSPGSRIRDGVELTDCFLRHTLGINGHGREGWGYKKMVRMRGLTIMKVQQQPQPDVWEALELEYLLGVVLMIYC